MEMTKMTMKPMAKKTLMSRLSFLKRKKKSSKRKMGRKRKKVEKTSLLVLRKVEALMSSHFHSWMPNTLILL